MVAGLTYFWQNPRSTTTAQNQCGEKIFLSTTGHQNAEIKFTWFLYFPFLYFEGRGLYMEAITINQETILSLKKGVISQWSRHDNVLLGFLFMCHVADIIADIKWKNFQCKRLSQSRRYFGLLALIYFTKIPLWMYRLKAEEGSFMIIATFVVKFKSIVRTLKYFKGWTFSNAGPFSAIVVFSPIDYVLKGRSHDFYKKYYLEIESNLFAYLQFPLGVVKVHQLWSQTINMCNN